MSEAQKEQEIESVFKSIATLGRGIYLSRHKIFKEIGLNSAQSELIFQLYNEGEMEMAEVSERLFISRGAVTQNVDVLLENDLVERIQTSEDRRRWKVKLTDKAYEVISQLNDIQRLKLHHVFAQSSMSELETVNKVLNKAKLELYKTKHI